MGRRSETLGSDDGPLRRSDFKLSETDVERLQALAEARSNRRTDALRSSIAAGHFWRQQTEWRQVERFDDDRLMITYSDGARREIVGIEGFPPIRLEPGQRTNGSIDDRLTAAERAVSDFEKLLARNPIAAEELFHSYLVRHPVLLDLRGTIHSKPRLRYPEGTGPLGNKYVEPDFVVRYANDTYTLIEIERPSHKIETRIGDPRFAVNHAAFQIAEWRDFINYHSALLQEEFPGSVPGNFHTAVVIGRTSSEFQTKQHFSIPLARETRTRGGRDLHL
jgi:hypothetical protein